MGVDAGRLNLFESFDVVMARQRARELAREMGFGLTDQTRIATAVSEVARRAQENRGTISFAIMMDGPRRGIECICAGVDLAEVEVNPLYPSVNGSAPRDLEGVKRLMDEFQLLEHNGKKTVVMRKWLR